MYIPGSEFTQKIATVCMIHQVPLSVALPIKTVTLEMCNYFFVMILTGIFGVKIYFYMLRSHVHDTNFTDSKFDVM